MAFPLSELDILESTYPFYFCIVTYFKAKLDIQWKKCRVGLDFIHQNSEFELENEK